jgi:hypothetical protein
MDALSACTLNVIFILAVGCELLEDGGAELSAGCEGKAGWIVEELVVGAGTNMARLGLPQ